MNQVKCRHCYAWVERTAAMCMHCRTTHPGSRTGSVTFQFMLLILLIIGVPAAAGFAVFKLVPEASRDGPAIPEVKEKFALFRQRVRALFSLSAPAPPPEHEAVNLRLGEWSWRKAAAAAHFSGVVTNASGRDIAGFTLTCVHYDKDDVELTRINREVVQDVAAGASVHLDDILMGIFSPEIDEMACGVTRVAPKDG